MAWPEEARHVEFDRVFDAFRQREDVSSVEAEQFIMKLAQAVALGYVPRLEDRLALGLDAQAMRLLSQIGVPEADVNDL